MKIMTAVGLTHFSIFANNFDTKQEDPKRCKIVIDNNNKKQHLKIYFIKMSYQLLIQKVAFI